MTKKRRVIEQAIIKKSIGASGLWQALHNDYETPVKLMNYVKKITAEGLLHFEDNKYTATQKGVEYFDSIVEYGRLCYVLSSKGYLKKREYNLIYCDCCEKQILAKKQMVKGELQWISTKEFNNQKVHRECVSSQ